MKTISFIIAAAFSFIVVRAQDPGGSYNPFVAQGTISPAPLLPLENNGAGVITFKVGNTGSDPLIWDVSKPNNDMILVITLSRGVPNIVPLNGITALATISGSYASKFSWVYDEFANTFYGRQNQTIPGLDLVNSTNEGTISILYKTTQNSSQSGPRNGFNLNITPPPYAGSNAVEDDNVSAFTWTEIRDYGDALFSYGSADHVIDAVNILYLGSLVDGELANQPSVMANGDDNTGMDDEDGIDFPVMVAGTTAMISVKTYGGGWLNAWIDWNADGDFEDVNEKISNNLYFTSGTNNLSVSVPQNAVTTGPTYARFRFGPSGTTSSGSAAYGEVEDYMVGILCAPLAPPMIGLITQPTCSIATGSVVLSGLPASGVWTLTRNPGGATTTGTGTSYTVNNLSAGDYTFSVSNFAGCNSTTSATVVINTQPATPPVPVIGTVTQTACGVETGSIALAGLPAAGSWTLTNIFGGETVTGIGPGITLIDLSAGSYSYTVTNAAGCTSPATVIVVINVPPAPAVAPVPAVADVPALPAAAAPLAPPQE